MKIAQANLGTWNNQNLDACGLMAFAPSSLLQIRQQIQGYQATMGNQTV